MLPQFHTDGPQHQGKLILKGGNKPKIILHTQKDAPLGVIKGGRREETEK